MTTPRILIGTSGWSYDHWREIYYPPHLAASKRLSYYQQFFHTVEVNSTFYSLPSIASLRDWYGNTPDDFIFAVKASRYITHMKKLRDSQSALKNFLNRVKVLRHKLGPILFQLPPRWRLNPKRLADFLEGLPREHRYAVEFRDPSWFSPRIYELLSDYSVAFCIFDLDRKLSPIEATTDFIYIRLHGPKGPYEGRYSTRSLHGWADLIAEWSGEGRDVYCYFDNDEAAYAVQDATRLRDMLITYNVRLGQGEPKAPMVSP